MVQSGMKDRHDATPAGGIEVSGSRHDLGCGVAARTVRISGSNNTIAGVDCGIPGSGPGGEGTTVSIAAPPVLVPQLDLSLTADRDRALPGEAIAYEATMRNGLEDRQGSGSARLIVPVMVGLHNLDSATATVEAVTYRFEVHDPATDEWRTWASTDPAAPADQQVVGLEGRPTPEPGVEYPAAGYAGTSVEPGSLASWASAATISLSVDQVEALFDPALVDQARSVVTIDTDVVRARKIARVSGDPLGEVRAGSGAVVTDGQIVATLPGSGPVVFDGTTTPELATLASGRSVSVASQVAVPFPEPPTPAESDAGYVARLTAMDEQVVDDAHGRQGYPRWTCWAVETLALR